MIGKINYGTGALLQFENYSSLPQVGSESSTYYVKNTNTFYVWNNTNGEYIRLKTRKNMYLLGQGLLNERTQQTLQVDKTRVTPIDPNTVELPVIGDIVFDTYGSCGVISAITTNNITITTEQASVTKRTEFANQSWDMWDQNENTIGHYYWDADTGNLTFQGVNRDRTSPIVYESYIINGGSANFITTGGTRVGSRFIVAWDGGELGNGTLRFYYTNGKANDSFTSNDEISTVGTVFSMIQSLSGIYYGIAQTEKDLREGRIVGTPPDHELSENDWAYVMHYAENVKQYASTSSFSVGDIIEYDSALYEVETAFTKSGSWAVDSNNCFSYAGTRRSFVYRTVNNVGSWVLGVEFEQDFPFPDEYRLTANSHNKMTIKAGGVDTASIADSAVTTPKIANKAVNNDKIADSTINKSKFVQETEEAVTKAETCWYSGNLIVSKNQPSAPVDGYIIWVDTDTTSL